MKAIIISVSALIMLLAGAFAYHQPEGTRAFPALSVACAGDDWNTEFEDVCSKSQDAMAYSEDELKALVDRCDKLKPAIEKLEGTKKKVYLKRLQMCRDLFVFTLESKKKERP